MGSLLAALGARWTGVRRRASIARLEVLTALGEYDAERKSAGDEPVASFPLDRWIEPRGGKNGRVRARPGTRGVGALMWDLQKARTKEEVDRDIARAQSLCSRIRRWLTVEPAARQASDLLDLSSSRAGVRDLRPRRALPPRPRAAPLPHPLAGQEHPGSRQDRRPRRRARRERRRPGRAHDRRRQVWALLRRLEQSDVPEEEYQRYDLVTARCREIAAENRTPEQTEALRRDLYRARAALDACARGTTSPPTRSSPSTARRPPTAEPRS